MMTVSFLLLGELFATLMLAGASKLAVSSGIAFFLFPELSALSFNVFARPAGAWARAPVGLVVMPTVAAVIGVAIARTVPYGFVSVALCIGTVIVMLRLLRSPVAPAISAGYLPVVLGFESWQYPATIALVTGTLAVASIAYRRLFAARIAAVAQPQTPHASLAPHWQNEKPVHRHGWIAPFIAFLVLAYGMAVLAKMPLILFPPLVVIAYEMFCHPDTCPWARRPFAMAAVCSIAAAAGIAAIALTGAGPLSVIIALIVAIATLRVFRLHFPPALAIALIPQVIAAPGVGFVLAVAVGSTTLALTFAASRLARANKSYVCAAPNIRTGINREK